MSESTFWQVRLSQILRWAKSGANGRIEQSSRGGNRAARQGKSIVKIVIRHSIKA